METTEGKNWSEEVTERNQAPKTFTAAHLALRLGLSDRAVRNQLDGVAHTSVELVNFKPAKVWAFAALPSQMRTKLHAIAEERGYGKDAGEKFLGACDVRWQPPLAFDEIDKPFIERAVKLQRALQPSLAILHLEGKDGTKRGLEGYQREFGREISEDHLRRLLRRTIERDRGFNEWHRVELFLDDAAFRRKSKVVVAAVLAFPDVQAVIDSICDKLQSTSAERNDVFHEAFLSLNAEEGNAPRRRSKRALLEFLVAAAPGLSKSPEALRRAFDDKWQKWIAGGGVRAALEDGRDENGRSKGDWSDLAKLTGLHAAKLNENVPAAFRDLMMNGGFPPHRIEAYLRMHPGIDLRKDPSYIGPIWDEAKDISVKRLPFEQGPKQVRKSRPRPRRDWNDIQPGDIFEADDLTVPIVWRHRNSNGIEAPIQGECLVMIDRRSRKILDFVLIAGKYNGVAVRYLVLKVVRKYGRPRMGMLFENGVWASRMITGEQIPHAEPMGAATWINALRDGTCFSQPPIVLSADRSRATSGLHAASTGGLQDAGIETRHALPNNPETKIIETVFRLAQVMMPKHPGFCGFNQRLDGYDRNIKGVAKAKRGNPAALGHLYTHEEMVRVLEQIFDQYNRTPQSTRSALNGATPNEAWAEVTSKRPLSIIPKSAEYLLASHCKIRPVERDGSIILRTTRGGEDRVFWDENTANLPVTKKVRVYWHIEEPSLVTVTDLKGRNPITLRERVIRSSTEAPETLAEIASVQGLIISNRRMIASDMPAETLNIVERASGEFSEEQHDLGERIVQQVEEKKAEVQLERRAIARIRRKAEARGFDPRNIPHPEMFADGAALEEEAMRRIEEKKRKGALL
jgi:hypothetical protein